MAVEKVAVAVVGIQVVAKAVVQPDTQAQQVIPLAAVEATDLKNK